MAQWKSVCLTTGRSVSYQRLLKWYLLPSRLALDIREWSGKLKMWSYQWTSPVAFTAFANLWPRATETEIGAALCAIGAGRTLTS